MHFETLIRDGVEYITVVCRLQFYIGGENDRDKHRGEISSHSLHNSYTLIFVSPYYVLLVIIVLYADIFVYSSSVILHRHTNTRTFSVKTPLKRFAHISNTNLDATTLEQRVKCNEEKNEEKDKIKKNVEALRAERELPAHLAWHVLCG